MPELFNEIASTSPSQIDGSYIYSVLPIAANRLAALTSADELLILDKTGLEPLSRHDSDVPRLASCMTGGNNAENVVICAGGDGVVAIFDVRKDQRVHHFKIDRAVTALAHHDHGLAVGSELAHSQAVVSIWDDRQWQMRWQSSENNDDITALQYHPSNHNHLLSGGDDGAISIFDTCIQDEMDSLVQAHNHGPIHQAGFLSDTAVYALSADHQFSIYPFNSLEEDDLDAIQPISFGDLRLTAQCSYVIDVLRDPHQPYVATGSNLSDPHVDLVPLAADPHFALSNDKVIRLQGGHGEEIVRSIYIDNATETVFTGGEDGSVKGFRAGGGLMASSQQPRSSARESKKGKSERFKPY